MKILDRYIVSELGGPFAFGLSAFTLIFVATQILQIGKLVSDEHAPLSAAIEYFLWQLPGIVILVIPMAMLLGVLLALQRLSGESEITALKAGGIGLARIVTPLLVVGFTVSLLALVLQEGVVPLTNDRAAYVRDQVIKHVSPINQNNLTVVTGLPGGGRQLTSATAFEASTQSLLNVTVIQYDRLAHPQEIIFSERAHYDTPTWLFTNANTYHFAAGGETTSSSTPLLRVDIGQKPSQLIQRAAHNNPEEMSRSEISQVLRSGQLTAMQMSTYESTYQAKLARPFASFVFTLIAVPFGLRPSRGGGSTSLGFGLAVAIVFVYYVISTIFTSVGSLGREFSLLGAWAPNAIFTAIGALMLRRAGAY